MTPCGKCVGCQTGGACRVVIATPPRTKAEKAAAHKRFMKFLRALDEIPPCFTCGRVRLVGKCCDGPHTDPAAKVKP